MKLNLKITTFALALLLSLGLTKDAFAVTDFVSIIDPSNGPGTDYTSLSAWEAAVDVDLTASTTLVFSHSGIVGSVPDGSRVDGANSAARGNVLHATDTQIFIDVSKPTFQSGERVEVDASNYVTITDNGDTAIAVASCRSTGDTKDTTEANISGWGTSSINYVKIWSDPNDGSRHKGVWDSSKYTLAPTGNDNGIKFSDSYTHLDGIQIDTSGSSGDGISALVNGSDYHISNNLIKGGYSGGAHGIDFRNNATGESAYIWNNIIYNYNYSGSYCVRMRGSSAGAVYLYNNTIYNCEEGIYQDTIAVYAKNNISYNNTNNYFGSYSTGSAYNLSGPTQTDAPGTNTVNAATVDFVSLASGYEDLHLSQTDTSARNSGADLSSDTYNPISDDIDTSTRNSDSLGWDIGADEVETNIYRSVGPSNTTALDTDNSHADTVTVISGVATFSANVPDNVGVGDAVLIDTGGTSQAIDSSDTILFIASRTSETSFSLQTAAGATPSDISVNDTYSIYRAYTSLSNAEAGTKNTSIPMTFSGGGRDLVANNEQWNIALYGDANDTTVVTIDGWTTSETNFIRMYAPAEATEVGTSQRHNGSWNDSAYSLEISSGDAVTVQDGYVMFEGIQVSHDENNNASQGIVAAGDSSSQYCNVIVDSSIIRSTQAGGESIVANSYATSLKVWNSVIYKSATSSGDNAGVKVSNSTAIAAVYNSDIYGYEDGVERDDGVVIVKNSAVFGNTDDFDGTMTLDYNASDDGDGTNSVTPSNWSTVFENYTSYNFHLKKTDTDLVNAGTDLSSKGFSDDIDGAKRDALLNNWEIGVDEITIEVYRSVGPGNTSALDTDDSHADTVTLGSEVVTFSEALPGNVGTGDAVVIDTGGTDQTLDSSDTLLFITSRISSTSFNVQAVDENSPSSISANDTYGVYRAYTSLANAESGTQNTAIPITFAGGNRDLVGNNEQLNLSCYGDAIDTTAVTIEGWTTGAQNYIKIYTPRTTSQAGLNQRHRGKWDSDKYTLQVSANTALAIKEGHVYVEGLQIENTNAVDWTDKGIWVWATGTTDDGIYIYDNIIKSDTPSANHVNGVAVYNSGGGSVYIYNNIVYDFTSSATGGAFYFEDSDYSVYLYNNTASNTGNCYNRVSGTVYAKNNIAQGCTDSFNGTFTSSEYNITDTSAQDGAFGTAADSGTTTATTASKLVDSTQNFTSTVEVGSIIANTTDITYTYVTAIDSDTTLSVNDDIFTTSEAYTIYANIYGDVDFESETSGLEDFHLAKTDSLARDTGADLSNDSSLSFNVDIDKNYRSDWDIGADEGSKEFEATVMQSGGDYTSLSAWETGNQTDLISAAVKVFSHSGITGSIADGASVTGVTSGATATVSHATSTQILLKGISGIFQSGEVVQVDISNYVTISDDGNPAAVVAKIDGAWTSADSAVDIAGWTTGQDNYIKIYTTSSARHSGKWDSGKYRIETSNDDGIMVSEDNVIIDGLQAIITNTSSTSQKAIHVRGATGECDVSISNNLLRGTNSGHDWHSGVAVWNNSGSGIVKVWNNIAYDFNGTNCNAYEFYDDNFTVYAYSNTATNSSIGFLRGSTTDVIAKNNISYNNTDNYSGTFNATNSTYNLSGPSQSDAPGTNPVNAASVDFVSTIAGVEDFHLGSGDSSARDSGTDLSDDSVIPFNVDIDGSIRPINSIWDIGADEARISIYRSVGPSNTSTLDDDNSNADTITISSGEATFSAAIADNVGVGDVILYDSSDDNSLTSADSVAFIRGRKDSTHYVLQAASGAVPADLSANDTWEIYRAYTSLANAESGTVNSTLSALSITYAGGDRDLVTNDEEWHIACYGDAADTAAVTIDGWTTGENNYIRIYTPVNTGEVGTSQRHSGVWNDTKYNIQSTGNVIYSMEGSVRIEGLQVYKTGDVYDTGAIQERGVSDTVEFYLTNSIIKGSGSTYSNTWQYGFATYADPSGNVYIYNNIFYNFLGGGLNIAAILANDADLNYYIYNNTIYNAYAGINNVNGTSVVKNNITQGVTDGYSGTFDASSDYNISNLAADAPGSNSQNSTTVTFESTVSGSEDFHLVGPNNPAVNSGTNLSNDSELSFDMDITGGSRPVSGNWDVGAIEYILPLKAKGQGILKFRGNVKFE